jgi:protein-arginine kinase activator protein McsA
MRPGGRTEEESPFVCRWFLDAVLPLDKDLQASLLAPHDLKKCERCGTMFAAGSNSAKFCSPCAAAEHKKAKREYAQQKRIKM